MEITSAGSLLLPQKAAQDIKEFTAEDAENAEENAVDSKLLIFPATSALSAVRAFLCALRVLCGEWFAVGSRAMNRDHGGSNHSNCFLKSAICCFNSATSLSSADTFSSSCAMRPESSAPEPAEAISSGGSQASTSPESRCA
jgi:hypothetical protein